MKRFYAGLDVGSSICELVVLNEQEQRANAATFATSEHNLIAKVQEARQQCPGEFHLALEEGEMAQWITGVLRKEVTRLVVCDPKRNAWIARDSGKNDKVDAYKLALLLKGSFVREVYHPQDQDRAEFKRVVQHYHALTANQAALKCQIKSRFRACGVIPKGAGLFSSKKREASLALLPSEPTRSMVGQLFTLLDSAMQTQKHALKLMVSMGRAFPEVALFQEVPGIGPVWSCTFSAYVQTPHRFRNRRKLWRFCQLAVTNRQSNGEPLGFQRLDRNGVGMLKHLSFRAFCAAMKQENEFRIHYRQSLERTKDRTHARLSTQRKILAVLYGMWKRNEPYRPFGKKEETEKNLARA